jgi:hypothetical protein
MILFILQKTNVECFNTNGDDKIIKKIGRNEPCPCGSGKKYKYCCLSKDDNVIPSKQQSSSLFDSNIYDIEKLSSQCFGSPEGLAVFADHICQSSLQLIESYDGKIPAATVFGMGSFKCLLVYDPSVPEVVSESLLMDSITKEIEVNTKRSQNKE